MNLVLYLAASLGFLFLFFFSMDRTGDESLFVYIGYTCLLMALYLLLVGIMDIIEGQRYKSKAKYDAILKRRADYKAEIKTRWGGR